MQRNRIVNDLEATQHAGAAAPPSPEEEDRLVAAVREYTAAKEAGRTIKREELLARYPDVAEDLSACLAGLAFVDSAAAEIPGAATPPGQPSGGPTAEGDAAGGATGDEPLSARPLGDFRLIREIGRGGMGVVYEAVQLSLGRRVAVKVLPLASALDSRQLQRFRNEAQAAAQLHHTNIVPVYAVGCERSVHFYAMQLIEGQSLADVIRELRKVAGRRAAPADDAVDDAVDRLGQTNPSALSSRAHEIPPESTGRESAGNLSGPLLAPSAATPADPSFAPLSSLRSSKRSAYFRAVARLALQAAEALEYAHGAGVVHRDIKPANLLLDAKGCLWITDFGLAQFYTENNLTQTGDLVGTLRYMSPEQASGRAVVLDQRTDVYSLGVTLYELLTLERALPGETREQLLQQHGSYDPRPARSIDKAIPPELETILIKATAKEPADRYASARALADDLVRFLQDEPILARPPSLWDKTVKWTRRHKTLALAAVVMLVLASAGLLASTLLIAREQHKTREAYVREQQRATEATEERAQATQQRAQAERSFRQARDAVSFLSRVAADELAGTPQSAEVRKEMLEAALDYYQGFLEDHQGDASVSVELDEAESYVKRILAELSAFEDFDRIDNTASLLSQVPVQVALKLSADQVSKATGIRADSNASTFDGTDGGGKSSRSGVPPLEFDGKGKLGKPEPPPDFQDMTEEQKQQRFAAAAARIETALKALLTQPQFARLQQISRQARAPASFSDPDVADALALTREQKDAVRRAQAACRIAMRKSPGRHGPDGPHGPGGPGGPDGPHGPDGRPGIADDAGADSTDDTGTIQQSLQNESVGQILASLGETQRDTWKRLTGEPLDGLEPIHFGPPEPGVHHHGPGHDGPEFGGPDHGGPDHGGPGGPGHDGPGSPGGHGPGDADGFQPPPPKPIDRSADPSHKPSSPGPLPGDGKQKAP